MFALTLLATLLSAEPAVSDASTEAARVAFLAGSENYKQSQFKKALEEFEKAARLKPHPTVTYNIGRCHEKLGDIPRALAAYRMYLKAAPESKDAKAVTDAVARFENELKAKGIVQHFVWAQPPDALIEVDGKIVGRSPATIELGAGSHSVTVSAPGHESFTQSFVTVLGRSSEMELALKKSDAPVASSEASSATKLVPADKTKMQTSVTIIDDPLKVPKPRVFTWVSAGVAVLAGGTGVVAGLMNKNTEKLITGVDRAAEPNAQVLQTRMGTEGTVANISFVTAGVAAAAAVVLFFVEGN
jgi:hypothetical protein